MRGHDEGHSRGDWSSWSPWFCEGPFEDVAGISLLAMLRNAAWSATRVCLGAGCLWLVGCGGQFVPVQRVYTSPVPTVAFAGKVLAGGKAVVGASVQLYAASNSGYAAASSSLLSAGVVSDGTGAFSVSASQYVCTTEAEQLYLVARGGSSNGALEFVTPMGSCGALVAGSVYVLNEVTTAGFVWAMAPFMGSAAAVGTSATNAAGMMHAFALAAMLADAKTGVSPAAGVSSQLKVASAKLYSLANSLAKCAMGGGSCAALFAATTVAGVAAATTAEAALVVVQHPAQRVAAVYQAGATGGPYAGLSVAPHDWTLSVESTGGGLVQPTGLAIDSTGQVWVASYAGALSAFSPLGTAVFNAPITGSGLEHIYAVAVDAGDNVWAGNTGSESLTKISQSGVVLSGTTGFTSQIAGPYAIESDASGSLWVADYGSAALVEIAGSGTVLLGPLQGKTRYDSGVALDAAGTPWVVGEDGSATHYSTSGQVLATGSCCSDATGAAIDSSGVLWVADYSGRGVDRVSTTTALAIGTTAGSGGLSTPNGIVLDGAGNAWLPNLYGGSISEVAGTTSGQVGVALSPSAGFGLDEGLDSPFAAAVDASGTLWVTSLNDHRLVRYVGIAAATKTPTLGPAMRP